MRSSDTWPDRHWLPALLLVLSLAACERPAAVESRQLVALGTMVTLGYYGVGAAEADAATRELEALYRARGRDWYPWADGELRRINAALAAGQPVAVRRPLRELLQRAARIEAASGGLFNPTLGALTELWGFHEPLAGDWQPPPPEAVRQLLAAAPGSAQLSWQGDVLASRSTAVQLDPGGIAKGALLEESAAILGAAGIDNAIIDLGGDLKVLGRAGRRAARIGIRDPAGDRPLGWLEAAPGEAVMTSGNYERWFEHDGHRYHHVLDPRSGYPAAHSASVTVVHRDAVLADAAATALLVAGPEGFEKTAAALGIELALLVTTGGDLRLTSAMRSRVHWPDRARVGGDSGTSVSQ